MRQFKHFIMLTAIISAFSCQEESIEEFEETIEKNQEESNFSLEEISNGENFKLGNFFDISLNGPAEILKNVSFSPVTLPWRGGTPTTQLPFFITQNNKPTDGWELLYNFMGVDSNEYRDYIMLYNVFSGVLRVYYYLDPLGAQGSTGGMWGFGLSKTTGLFNSSTYFTEPSNIRNNDNYYTTNISKTANKGFGSGWNVFDVELTYDPNILNEEDLYMSITNYNNDVTSFTATGIVDLFSEGSIVQGKQTSSTKDYTKQVSKAAGDKGKEYLVNLIDTTASKSDITKPLKAGLDILSAIASGGTSPLIQAGLDLAFGSLFGKDTPEPSSLSFTTNGQITLNGTLEQDNSSNVVGISNIYFPGSIIPEGNDFIPYDNRIIGNWNLTDAPTVYISENLHLVGDNGYGTDIFVRNAHISASEVESLFVINPDIENKIEYYELTSELVFYEKFHGENNWRNMGYNGQIKHFGTLIYDNVDSGTLIRSNTYEEIHIPNQSGPEPGEGNHDEEEDGDSGVPILNYTSFNKNYVVKVRLKLFPKAGYNQEPITYTRSYLPVYQLVTY